LPQLQSQAVKQTFVNDVFYFILVSGLLRKISCFIQTCAQHNETKLGQPVMWVFTCLVF